jgi:poly(hydroxyalkanoate) granule-associated protein
MASKQLSLTDRAYQFGDDLKRLGRNTWLAGLGTVATVEEEARAWVDRMVAKGEGLEKDDRIRVGRTLDQAVKEGKKVQERIETGIQDTVSGVLHRAGVPDREEIHTLIDRVDKLSKKVDGLRT